MYYKVLLEDGTEFIGRRGFWELFSEGWFRHHFVICDDTFGVDMRGKRIIVRSKLIIYAIRLGKKLS